MRRDVVGMHTNTKPNPVKLIPDSSVSEETAHVSPKISGLLVADRDKEPSPIMNDSKVVENENNRDVVGNKTTDYKSSTRVQKIDSDSKVKRNGKPDESDVQPQYIHARGEIADSAEKISNESKNTVKSTNAKELQPLFPRGTRKPPQSERKKQFDEEASAKTSKFKNTAPRAPVFTCVSHLEKRKQFYSKLEEKQAAVEAERLENEARIKEKEQAIIRQLRKNMVFKANPMPSFYREGPPPKPQLKKLPVTRAKSPKLSRRKSCGDVMSRSSSDEKGTGSYRNFRHTSTSPLNKTVQNSGKKGEAIARKSMYDSEKVTEDTNNHTPHRVSQERNEDIAVNSSGSLSTIG